MDTNFITSLMRRLWDGKNLFLSFFKLGITRIPMISPYVYFGRKVQADLGERGIGFIQKDYAKYIV